MSNLNQTLFYRRHGVRQAQQLMSPVLSDLSTLELPLSSIYHHVTYDGIAVGPAPDEMLFKGNVRPIFVNSISETVEHKGNPRKILPNDLSLWKDLRNQNRRVRPLRDLEAAVKDPLTLVTYNYCFIGKSYRYVRSVFTEYYKWYNTFRTMVHHVADLSKKVQSNQYLLMGVPRIIPSVTQLDAASAAGDINQGLLKVFREANSFGLLELWKWMGASRASSSLSAIPLNRLHLVNIVFQETGQWVVVNLGHLNSFRIPMEADGVSPAEGEQAFFKGNGAMDAESLQKRFLRFLMKLMEARTVTANIDDAELYAEPAATPEEGEGLDYGDEEDTEVGKTRVTVPSVTDETSVAAGSNADDEDVDETDAERKQRIEQEDIDLNLELARLNDIALRQEDLVDAEHASVQEIIAAADVTLDEGVMSVCEKLADDGMLTAKEYQRFEKHASTYKTMKNPYNTGGTVAELIDVKSSDLTLSDKNHIVDSDTILDKSMLRSSLVQFDAKYIDEVLPRHAVAMVANCQRAGVALTDYQIEENDDVLGTYEVHAIKLTPVIGAPSTLRFRIPKIDESGVYTSNGVKYRISKQRGEIPLRKVNASKVALTSYYGKAFINRGRKLVYDYGRWLTNQVMNKGLNKEDPDISKLMPADVSDSDAKLPRVYSALSKSFKSVDVRGYTVMFDQREVRKTIAPVVLQKFGGDGNLIIGSSSKGYLVMDAMGTVYVTTGDKMEVFGTFEQFLNIDTTRAPVEFASAAVFGKDIPLAIILSYYFGFSNLMKILKVEPRRVEAGQRANVTPDEYALVFADETLVFNRSDRLAAMILGGYHEYDKAIRLFSVYSFDAKGVYLNLLETAKLSVRHLRELDLLQQMFVDPITKLLLEQMKEPKTYQGLLFRAAELLLDDQHPDEFDPAFMRIKGYERIPGAIYSELIQAIRIHNGTMGKSNRKIEMNPYAVWKRIVEDPAKLQVNEINPVAEIKESEAVTYTGFGGRVKRSMTKDARGYHPNDMGTISEATKDSSDVSINVFTSANPKFTSLLGISERYDQGKDGAASLLSSSALLAPSSDRDD